MPPARRDRRARATPARGSAGTRPRARCDGGGSRVLLQVTTETVETVVPEPVERVHPLPHLVEALGVEVVAALPAVALLGHESYPPQHREMLRHRGAAHRHGGGELVGRL